MQYILAPEADNYGSMKLGQYKPCHQMPSVNAIRLAPNLYINTKIGRFEGK